MLHARIICRFVGTQGCWIQPRQLLLKRFGALAVLNSGQNTFENAIFDWRQCRIHKLRYAGRRRREERLPPVDVPVSVGGGPFRSTFPQHVEDKIRSSSRVYLCPDQTVGTKLFKWRIIVRFGALTDKDDNHPRSN